MSKNIEKIRLETYWKLIDDIVGVNPYTLTENIRKKYYATKSLLLKESEYFKKSMKVATSDEKFLTENVDLNKKDLLEYVDQTLVELSNKKGSISKLISESAVNNDKESKRKMRLETLMVGDVLMYLAESKTTSIDSLGLKISKELIESYIDTLFELTK